MTNINRFYIDGAWVAPKPGGDTFEVVNPTTEERIGAVSLGTDADVDRAVMAAIDAFPSYSRTSVADRLALFDRVIGEYERRAPDLASALSREMGAPRWVAEELQVTVGTAHLKTARDALANYQFSQISGGTTIVKEPIGVCGFITPWNWPLNQITCKVAPALAVGCTMILKPSEFTPSVATIFAEILDAAGVPDGVFNMVHGDATTGSALSAHPGVDMISFTGSTMAGVQVARDAALTVKRVHQELGGKSPNIILRSADLAKTVAAGVTAVMVNSGQSCNAPTRMLVPLEVMDKAKDIAARTVEESLSVGPPESDVALGPVVSSRQWERIQALIEAGLAEGATLVAGGPGRPAGLSKGYYVRPTVFGDVTNDMRIAREEVFGPVICIIGYRDEQDAIRIANDTDYGLAAYIQGEKEDARRIAAEVRAGQVLLNGAADDFTAPFGGFKKSGNGREWGAQAFGEFLESKAVIGL